MQLSAVAKTAHQGDPARFEAAMFAPPDRREDLFALIALNVELSRIPETVSEPILGEIRLQWWDDALGALFDERRKEGHEVIAALAKPVAEGRLPKNRLIDLVDARRLTLSDQPLDKVEALDRLISQTGGALAASQIAALGGDQAAQDAAADAGWAEGAGRLIAALPAMLGSGQIDEKAIETGDAPPALAALVLTLAETGARKLKQARKARGDIPRTCRAPLLSIRPQERRLNAVLAPGANIFLDDGAVSPFRERLSLLRRAITGRF